MDISSSICFCVCSKADGKGDSQKAVSGGSRTGMVSYEYRKSETMGRNFAEVKRYLLEMEEL